MSASDWNGKYSVQGSGWFKDSSGKTNYPAPTGFFSGLGNDPVADDGASSEPQFYIYSYSPAGSDYRPNWSLRWDLRPRDYAVTQMSFSLPNPTGPGKWVSYNYGFYTPLLWLTLPVGHVVKSQTRYGNHYSLSMHRLNATSWEVDFTLIHQVRQGMIKSGYFRITADRPAPSWHSLRLDGDLKTTEDAAYWLSLSLAAGGKF